MKPLERARYNGMTNRDTLGIMSSAKIAISIDNEDLEELDQLVKRGVAPSRSRLIQEAVHDKLARLKRTRLAAECAKLDPKHEQAEAESWLGAEDAWPAY